MTWLDKLFSRRISNKLTVKKKWIHNRGFYISKVQNKDHDFEIWPCDLSYGQRSRGSVMKSHVYDSWFMGCNS